MAKPKTLTLRLDDEYGEALAKVMRDLRFHRTASAAIRYIVKQWPKACSALYEHNRFERRVRDAFEQLQQAEEMRREADRIEEGARKWLAEVMAEDAGDRMVDVNGR